MSRFVLSLSFIASLVCSPLATCGAEEAKSADAAPAKKPIVLKVGDKAPEFSAQTDQDKPWKSTEHVGKKNVVVYFYPADMTPGCTAQACSYRDALEKLERDDVEVVGVSGDSVANHQHFKREYKLNYALLADPEGKIARAFGVKTGDGGTFKRELEGKDVTFDRGVTASRWTFVIGLDGRIAYIDRQVDPRLDSTKVLKTIAALPTARTAQ